MLTFWSFGKLRFRDEDFFKIFFETVNKNLDKFPLRMLTLILYSSSNLNFTNKNVKKLFNF